jgi:hypothetical protein
LRKGANATKQSGLHLAVWIASLTLATTLEVGARFLALGYNSRLVCYSLLNGHSPTSSACL